VIPLRADLPENTRSFYLWPEMNKKAKFLSERASPFRKNTVDIYLIRSLKFSRWDSRQFQWVVQVLREYYLKHQPKEWLFEGLPGQQYWKFENKFGTW
jgi:uncharacterized Zn finger protein